MHHERRPGIGPLAGWRGADGSRTGRGEPNPDQLQRYIEHGCFWQDELAPEARFYKHANRAYLEYARAMGFIERAEPITCSCTARSCRSSAWPRRATARCSRPGGIASVCAPTSIRCRSGIPPFEAADAEADFPLHAITQRPAAMYHSWGSMNPWLRQIHSCNRLYLHRTQAERLGLEDDDWAWVTSRHGRIKAQVRLMDGVNPDTCWTWNAIGKRAGAWHLAPDAPEATKVVSCSII